MASDDDADDDGYDIEIDSSDERQLGAGSATGRRSESTGKCKAASICFISYAVYPSTTSRRRLEIQGSSHHSLQEMVIQLLFELDSVIFKPRGDSAVDLGYQ
jgi:hypothetical protein